MGKQTKKTPLIKKHATMIAALAKAPPKLRSLLIREAPNEIIHCVAECCQNVLKGNVHLSPLQKSRLHSKRQQLRNIASKAVTLKEKRKILNQKGGFLPLLLPLIAGSVLGGVLAK